jgi:hypothetical protein
MRLPLMLTLVVCLTSCSGSGGHHDNYSRTPLTVAGVTYNWPSSSSSDARGNPSGDSSHFALFPKSLWNETVGTMPSMRFPQDDGDLTIWLGPAKASSWNIQPDGRNLPDSIVFSKAKKEGNALVGEDDRPTYASPPAVVVFEGEPEAYVTCVGQNGPRPICQLFMNDRGVEHTLPATWSAWGEVPTALKLYRAAIGAPNPAK